MITKKQQLLSDTFSESFVPVTNSFSAFMEIHKDANLLTYTKAYPKVTCNICGHVLTQQEVNLFDECMAIRQNYKPSKYKYCATCWVSVNQRDEQRRLKFHITELGLAKDKSILVPPILMYAVDQIRLVCPFYRGSTVMTHSTTKTIRLDVEFKLNFRVPIATQNDIPDYVEHFIVEALKVGAIELPKAWPVLKPGWPSL